MNEETNNLLRQICRLLWVILIQVVAILTVLANSAHAAIVCPPGTTLVDRVNVWGNLYSTCEGKRSDLDEHGCIMGSEWRNEKCHAPDIAEPEPSCEEYLWHERRALRAAKRTIKKLRRKR